MKIKYPSRSSKDPKRRSMELWIRSQRIAYNKGELSQERIKKLEQLPGWTWDPISDQWLTRYRKLLEFIREHGRLPSQHSEITQETLLGTWSSKQRQAYKKGKLSKEQISHLERVPGWSWDLLLDDWKSHYSEVLKLAKKGAIPHCRSQPHGMWISRQRKTYKKGKLSIGRIKKLEQIPGWQWDQFADQWNANYTKILAFVKRNERFPSKKGREKPLGTWIDNLRYRKNLSQERITKLEAIPGWVWAA